ncbi:MAG TPA: ATP-dependent zinc metalloprotease FtsH [Candidatus Angelobacter sp.]|jgi:cell division protease FtsH|nr:ATP-dependent zinc metalloprotease FtsH [Candidatus Angelobacter sp.]
MEKKSKNNIFCIYAIILFFLIGVFVYYKSSFSKIRRIDQDKFFQILSLGKIEKVTVHRKEIVDVFLKKRKISNDKKNGCFFSKKLKNIISFPKYEFEIGDLQFFQNKFEEYRRIYQLNTIIDFKNNQEWPIIRVILDYSFFIVLFISLCIFAARRIIPGGGGHIFNIGKSKIHSFEYTKIKFDDVAGMEGAKEEVKEIVQFLKYPQKYTRLGGKVPRGALLIGPPGSGKTLLAKAVAGEAKVPFFPLAGSEFVEMFVGVGASRVRDIFDRAKMKSPSIIFIDEIDAIGRARGRSSINGSNDERENTLNQLLTEMDGFDTNTNVIVIAATNCAEILDRALLRPGRFDRTIIIDLPELNERKEIFKVHLKKIVFSENINIDLLAQQTPGFSGADISNICNEAALIATRKNKESVENQDFLDAIDRIIGGLEKKGKIITTNEKKRIAYHEAGHAVVSWLLQHAAPLVKVTLVPRGKSLGSAWYLPDDRKIITREQMKDEICALLGGRAAEENIFNDISTGALNDLERITKQAQSMVSMFGLNDRIGNISYSSLQNGVEYVFVKPYSEKTAQIIDEEVSKLINTQYQRAKSILNKNKEKLDLLADRLLEQEVIFKENLEELFGKRPQSWGTT